MHAHRVQQRAGLLIRRMRCLPVDEMIDLVHLRHQRIAQLLPLPGHVHHRPRAAPAKALVGKRHHRAADDPRHAVAQHLAQTVHHAEAIHAREHRIDDQDVRRTLPAAAQHRAAVRDDLHRAVLAVVQLPLQTLRHAPVAYSAEDIHLAQHIDCPPFAPHAAVCRLAIPSLCSSIHSMYMP